MNKNKLLITMCLILCITMAVLPAQAGERRYVPTQAEWVAVVVNGTQSVLEPELALQVFSVKNTIIIDVGYDPATVPQAQAQAFAQNAADVANDYIASKRFKGLTVEIDVTASGQ